MVEVQSRRLEQVQNRLLEALQEPKLPSVSRLAKEELKVWEKKDAIIDALRTNDTLLLIAGTGTGKTRAGSQIALEAIGSTGKMVMTENLRKATEMSAQTVAEDMGEQVGQTVGVQNRYRRQFSESTRLLFCPTQSLLNKIENDHDLMEYDLIMIDEVHKESKQNEILLATLRDIQKKRKAFGRPLKLILTSATMDDKKLSTYFGNDEGKKAGNADELKVAKIEIPGTTFEIDKVWHDRKVPAAKVPKVAAEKVQFSIENGDHGNILVFLSGKAQIDETQKYLQALKLKDTIIVPYYGAMSKKDQDAAAASFGNKRVVVLATNAAQESLTWPVQVVVDGCVHKHTQYDPFTGRSYLMEADAPLDHLTQRMGRIGRREPKNGIKDRYYALTTEDEWKSRPKHESAEIQRTDITSEVLTLIASGYDPYSFPFVNVPYPSHIKTAMMRLEKLGAIEGTTLTEKGKFMSQLQLGVSNASLVTEGIMHGNIEDAAALAAMLEVYPRVFETPNEVMKGLLHTSEKTGEKPQSDLIPMIRLLQTYGTVETGQRKQWLAERGLRPDVMRDAYDLYRELTEQAQTARIKRHGVFFRETALDLAIHRSFADIDISGIGSSSLRMKFGGGELAVGVDRSSVLSGRRSLPPLVSADIYTVAHNSIIEKRTARLNHALSAEAVRILDQERAQKQTHTEELPTVAPVATAPSVSPEPTTSHVENSLDVPQELPPDVFIPPPPQTLWQRVTNWFKDLLDWW
jgi:HrpA-like RNA helicase